jgi:hypothetical protein
MLHDYRRRILLRCLLPALVCLVLAARLCAGQNPAASQSPPAPIGADADDHAALIPLMRQFAYSYTESLRDFLCTKITTRSGDRSGGGTRWKPLDVQEAEIGYVDHQETETLKKVNGQSARLKITQGYFIPGGEFGESLLEIFAGGVHAQFTFDHQEAAGAQQLCVFRYRVALETSRWGMTDGSQSVTFAHHGMVYADCSTGAVMRLHMESEPAEMHRLGFHFPVGLRLDVSYRPTPIAGREFLLPSTAEAISWYGTDWTRAEMQFQNYRKFEATSRIVIPDRQEAPDAPTGPAAPAQQRQP